MVYILNQTIINEYDLLRHFSWQSNTKSLTFDVLAFSKGSKTPQVIPYCITFIMFEAATWTAGLEAEGGDRDDYCWRKQQNTAVFHHPVKMKQKKAATADVMCCSSQISSPFRSHVSATPIEKNTRHRNDSLFLCVPTYCIKGRRGCWLSLMGPPVYIHTLLFTPKRNPRVC